MLVLLLFCFCSANFVQSMEDSGIITVSAEGNTEMNCNQFSSSLVPLKVKVVVEEGRNQSWVILVLNSIFVELNTTRPSLSPSAEESRHNSPKYPCSAYNAVVALNDVTFDPGKNEMMLCNNSVEWKTLKWSHQGGPIAMVIREDTKINIRVVRKGPSSISITSIISPDSDSYLPNAKPQEKTVLLSCAVKTGFEKFIEGKYWIIVVSTLGYILFCLIASCGYMTIRRRKKAEKRRKAKARFFKMNSTRNMYVESINQEPANLKQNGMYQNFTLTKDISSDHLSNKSSFLDPSEEGDSYLNPMEDVDEISDDGDCYENANEEIKEGSIGSQSYEDMNGPVNGECLTPVKACEEDADSYENMQGQTPLYSQLNRSINSLGQTIEDEVEQTGSKMVDVSPEQQEPASSELKQQNGDFYLSYQPSK